MSLNTEPAWYQKWLRKEDNTPKPVLTTDPTKTPNFAELSRVNIFLRPKFII